MANLPDRGRQRKAGGQTVSYHHDVYKKILFSNQTKQKLISHHQRMQLGKNRQLDVTVSAFNSSTQEAQPGGAP